MKLDELVNKYYNILNENDIYIWNYISKHRDVCHNLTITELAEKCNVSHTTIMRFSKKLSLKGFSELKFHLKLEQETITQQETECVDTIVLSYHKFIEDMKNLNCNEICHKISKAKNIYIFSTGVLQSTVSIEMRRIFLNAGIAMHMFNDKHESEMLLNVVTKDDLVIIISLSGNSSTAVTLVQNLKMMSVPTLSITELSKNKLSSLSYFNLYISTTKISVGLGNSYTTTTMFFILIEMLFLKFQDLEMSDLL